MPSKVSPPGAEHDREPTAEELKRELAEAREQQVATHELLRIIGQAHADPQSVLEAIARNAARLCGAKHTSIWRSTAACSEQWLLTTCQRSANAL